MSDHVGRADVNPVEIPVSTNVRLQITKRENSAAAQAVDLPVYKNMKNLTEGILYQDIFKNTYGFD